LANELRKKMRLDSALKYVNISKSTYYYHGIGADREKLQRRLDPELVGALEQLQEYELTLGYRKLTKYLRRKYQHVWNKKKVYRHMKRLGFLQPKRIKQRWIRNRRLAAYCAIQSNVRWEADLAIVPTQMGTLNLFIIEDTCDRELISGQMGLQCGAAQAKATLAEALRKQFGKESVQGLSLTLRVDRGCQFTAQEFIVYTQECGIKVEYCGVQTPNDKPYIESFISCYKNEEVYRNQYEDYFQAHEGWKRYVSWYNNERPHRSLGDLSPLQFRALYQEDQV
jgi:putative transposase